MEPSPGLPLFFSTLDDHLAADREWDAMTYGLVLLPVTVSPQEYQYHDV